MYTLYNGDGDVGDGDVVTLRPQMSSILTFSLDFFALSEICTKGVTKRDTLGGG